MILLISARLLEMTVIKIMLAKHSMYEEISIALWFSISAILFSVMHSKYGGGRTLCISLLDMTVSGMPLVPNAGKMAIIDHQS